MTKLYRKELPKKKKKKGKKRLSIPEKKKRKELLKIYFGSWDLKLNIKRVEIGHNTWRQNFAGTPDRKRNLKVLETEDGKAYFSRKMTAEMLGMKWESYRWHEMMHHIPFTIYISESGWYRVSDYQLELLKYAQAQVKKRHWQWRDAGNYLHKHWYSEVNNERPGQKITVQGVPSGLKYMDQKQ